MDRNNIGIVTLPGHFNYGNRLQCYAVSKVYERCGLSSEELVLAQRFKMRRTAARIVRKALNKERANPEDMMSDSRKDAFARFDSRIQSRTVRCLAPLAGEYDLFSVGSDQTWNPAHFAYNEDWYFLSFARPGQRIALAPSIGVESVTPKQARQIARGVGGFPSLSVREGRGAEIIEESSGRKAEVICDPTLVLAAEEWRAVSDRRLNPVGPYVLAYLLGKTGRDATAALDGATCHGRIPVVPLSDREKPDEPPAGPAEFISLVDGAAHVVTDSFHAAVFSCILQTPLTIVRREGGSSMFSRLQNLTETLGITSKVYGSPGFDLSRAGDFSGVPDAIGRERRRFTEYLEGCLDRQLPGWRGGQNA